MHWYEKPLKIIDRIGIDRLLFIENKFDAKLAVEEKVSLGFNAEHFSLHIRGDNPLKYVEHIKKYVSYAKKDLKVFLYVNVHWHPLKDARKHPSWFQVNYKGTLIKDVYGNGVMPCVNSRDYREYIYNVLVELAKTGIHGIFLDGPVFHRKGCYCRSCREKFREKYGFEIPKKGDFENIKHRFLVEFQHESLRDFLKGAYEAVKKANPKIVLYMNGEPVRPNWAAGRDNILLKDYQDLVGAEGGFEYYNLLESPFFKCEMTAKLLEAQVPEKPRVIFIAAKHSPWNRETLTPEELKIRCAQTIANGANYWIGVTHRSDDLFKAIREINGWINDSNEEYYIKTRDASDIGLYWSQKTANFYGGEVPTSDFTGRKIKVKRDYMKSFVGAYEMFLRLHIPFKLVIDGGQLDGLKMLVLANVAILSREEIAAIRNFVENGGIILSTYETSMFNIDAERLFNFSMEDVLGINYNGIEEYNGYENYFEIMGRDIPAPYYVIKATPTTGSKLGIIYENTKGWYQDLKKTDFPSVVVNDYGLGKSIYIAGSFFQTFNFYRPASYLKILDSLIGNFYRKPIYLENSPTSISLSLRENKDSYILHLVNFTSDLKRPIEYVSPIKNLRIIVNTDKLEINVKNIKPLIDNKKIRISKKNNLVKITLPRLNIYEAIALPKK
ncbi:MAG: beta-galactosidase trimerization domain-containing protein [Thermoproteales archaeon]|nr:beta-galactosidase trimerization domain-containing protein [Thermoproteales archaeon]